MQPPDIIKGAIQIDSYSSYEFELDDWKITKLLEDIMLVEYIDVDETGTQIKRGSIWVPLHSVTFVWRVGRVLLAGSGCKEIKEGDFVVFPNDKGIKAANINGYKNVVFLNECRIFGICTKEDNESVPSRS